jgi:hypothetical protein
MPQETNDTITQQDSTPPEAEQPGTTPPDAESSGTTPPAAEQSGTPDPEAIEKIVKRRLDRARKQWEQERTEAEERARMSEAERLKTDLEAKDEELERLKAELESTRRLSELVGKVRDPKAALKLLDDEHVDDEGNVNVENLLEAYPFLAPEDARPTARSAPSPAPATGAPARNPFAKESLNLTEQARLLRENPTLAASLKKQAGN